MIFSRLTLSNLLCLWVVIPCGKFCPDTKFSRDDYRLLRHDFLSSCSLLQNCQWADTKRKWIMERQNSSCAAWFRFQSLSISQIHGSDILNIIHEFVFCEPGRGLELFSVGHRLLSGVDNALICGRSNCSVSSHMSGSCIVYDRGGDYNAPRSHKAVSPYFLGKQYCLLFYAAVQGHNWSI